MPEPMPEKKGGGLLAMLAPKGSDEAVDTTKPLGPSDEDGGDDFAMVAGDVMQALKDKDADAFAESLRAFVGMC